jgi:hypothetical protein
VLWTVGLRDSAAAFLRRAVERDPTSPSVLDNASNFFLLRMHDTATAVQYCDRLVELGAGEACTANIAVARGHPDTAIALYRRAVSEQEQLTGTGGSFGLWPTRSLVRALAKAGRRAEARAIVQQTEQRANTGGPYVREDVIAMMWGLVGDSDRAFAWWERALRAGSAGIGVLYHSTVEDPVRHDPRMRALAKRAGLPDPPPYWP